MLGWLAKSAITNGLSYSVMGSPVIVIVGLAMISITIFLWFWLNSTNRRIHMNNAAMVLIERELQIRGKERIAYMIEKFPHISGSKSVMGIYLTLISVWGIVVSLNVVYTHSSILHHIIRLLLQFAK